MFEFQPPRMQCLTWKGSPGLTLLVRQPRRTPFSAIDRIADQRKPRVLHMDANLVGSARLELQVQQRGPGQVPIDAVVGDCASTVGANNLASSVDRMAAQRRVHVPTCNYPSPDQCPVISTNLAPLEGLDEMIVRARCARDHEAPG